jgi:hypothetical protein
MPSELIDSTKLNPYNSKLAEIMEAAQGNQN